MANSNSEHSVKLRRETAARINREKLQSGEYKQFAVKGRAQDIDVILAAIEKAGGSKTQALLKICRDWQQG